MWGSGGRQVDVLGVESAVAIYGGIGGSHVCVRMVKGGSTVEG